MRKLVKCRWAIVKGPYESMSMGDQRLKKCGINMKVFRKDRDDCMPWLGYNVKREKLKSYVPIHR